MYCSPRFSSLHYDTLTRVASLELDTFLERVSTLTSHKQPTSVAIKPLIQAACCNIFSGYMCSTRFSYEDTAFRHIVHLFDEIFWEINQVRASREMD